MKNAPLRHWLPLCPPPRFRPDTRQKKRARIALPNSTWLVSGMATLRDGTVAILGPAVTKIDLVGAHLTNFARFGNEQYFLNNPIPQLPMGGKSSIVCFGENRSSKTMWFGHIPLE